MSSVSCIRRHLRRSQGRHVSTCGVFTASITLAIHKREELFTEVHHDTSFSINIYGSQLADLNFDHIAILYAPATVDAAYDHDGDGQVPGHRTRRESGTRQGTGQGCFRLMRPLSPRSHRCTTATTRANQARLRRCIPESCWPLSAVGPTSTSSCRYEREFLHHAAFGTRLSRSKTEPSAARRIRDRLTR